ncbi:hypothetical protein [Streptomyces hiroshimensis]|uniref:Uncharacterized protein n=1 Tax=Streptomyces hiroshimensis TaxID=66424 RepID=A0ABQ2YJN2_9ACTN|nr:hypothetical protein [Streptomyces hiroshimensis]GGX84353.1 hypothetical protein GCM10010324_32430 [Streptomyces hiroshimensis]
MNTATMNTDPTTGESPLAHALRAIKAFAGAAVSVVVLGQYADDRKA